MKGSALAATAIVFAAIMALFIALLAASPAQVGNNVNFEVVGDVAPAISGETLTGQQFELLDQRGDWAVSYTHLPSPRDATLSRMPSSA